MNRECWGGDTGREAGKGALGAVGQGAAHGWGLEDSSLPSLGTPPSLADSGPALGDVQIWAQLPALWACWVPRSCPHILRFAPFLVSARSPHLWGMAPGGPI